MYSCIFKKDYSLCAEKALVNSFIMKFINKKKSQNLTQNYYPLMLACLINQGRNVLGRTLSGQWGIL